MEIRFKTLDIECRDDGVYKIGGYVNVTERESELLYSAKRSKWFNETVKQGAFKRSLSSGKDIPLLLEHDYEKRLADTTGNLTLVEDQIGLRFDAEIRDKDVYEKVKSKQINNCSFGFKPIEQDFESVSEVREKRYLKDLELLEISLVENPAYAGSLVEVRNMNAKEAEKEDEIKDEEKPKNKESKDKTEGKTEDKPKKKETEENTDKEKEAEDKKTPENKDVPKEKETPKGKDKNEEERGFVEEQIEKTQQLLEDNADSKEVIDEIIEEKEQQLQTAEFIEDIVKDDLNYVKQSNKEYENMLENDVARRSAEVLKLRVQIMKLKSI